jgi:hypothetical protein
MKNTLTGGDGSTGQTGLQVINAINENFSFDEKVTGLRPAEIATGAGTEASPYTNATDTAAGIQVKIDLLAAGRGGKIILGADRYDVTNTDGMVVTTECIEIEGVSAGKQANPNGESEGLNGTKIRFSGNGIEVRRTTAPRISVHVRKVYFYSDTALQTAATNGSTGVGTKAIWINGFLEQGNFNEVKVNNADFGVYNNTASSTFFDVVNFSRMLILGGRYGMYYGSSGSGVYCNIKESVIADNLKHCLYVNDNNQYYHWTVSGNAFVRGCGATGILDNPSNIFWGADYSAFYGNIVNGAGLDWIPTPTQYTADGIIVSGDNNAVFGNIIRENEGTSSYGMRVTGTGNYITGNKFHTNTSDLILTAASNGNQVICPLGTTVTDSGVRNVVNGISVNAGDPTSAGNWNGIAKSALLTIHDTTNGYHYYYPFGATSGTTPFRVRYSSSQFQVQNYATGAADLAALGVNNGVTSGTWFVTTASHANLPSACVIFSGAANGIAVSLDGTTAHIRFSGTSTTLKDATNIVLGSTTGNKIGTATTQKLALWNKTPIVQPTTAITAAAFVANSSGIANDTATYGGYTQGQMAAAMIAFGLLA